MRQSRSYTPEVIRGWVVTYVDRKSIGGDGLCRPGIGGAAVAAPVFRTKKDALTWYSNTNHGAAMSPSHTVRRCIVRLEAGR